MNLKDLWEYLDEMIDGANMLDLLFEVKKLTKEEMFELRTNLGVLRNMLTEELGWE